MRKILILPTAAMMIMMTAAAWAFDLPSKMDAADRAFAKGDWVEGAAITREALDSVAPGDPARPMLWSNLGMALFRAGDDPLRALAALDSAAALAPSSVTIAMNRGRVNAALGRYEEALPGFALAARLDSVNPEPLYLHSVTAVAIGDTLTARQSLIRMQTSFPHDLLTLAAEAAYSTATGDLRRAIMYWTTLIDGDARPEWLDERARLHMALDELGEASEDIARAIGLDPLNPELYLTRALLNDLRYRPDDAAADRRRAAELLGGK